MSFFLGLFFLGIGALGSMILGKNDQGANLWGNILAAVGSFFGLLSSIFVIFGGKTFSYSHASSFPLMSISFAVDQLSGFFIFVISLIALVTSLYGLGYAKYFFKKYNIGSLGFFYNSFIAGMLIVVSASNAIFFLIAWEIMSLASYFLVIFENNERENIRAGNIYFIMTHSGTAFIILAFLLLYGVTGTFDFGMMKEHIGNITPLTKNLVFVLALIGFGIKAGIIPLHIWLPGAHPAAPTHVSALMSGVMIKTGIFMFIKIFVDILPNPPVWWGGVILIIGAISALLGVLYALTEHDIKRLLAYHSIENIGIILLGLGSGLIFLSLDMKALAIIGFTAALFHTLNHAIFKALLFLSAGSVILKVHTRNMEEYGGLIRYMPQTAFFFLVGAMAISALPPFNGFFSEWLTFQSLFEGIRILDTSVRWIFILAAGVLAFTGGFAAACFVKAFGVTFLARPRSVAVFQAKDPNFLLKIGMAVLATLTVIIGIFSGSIAKILTGVVTNLIGVHALPPAASLGGMTVLSLAPYLFIGLASAIAIVFFISRFASRNQKVTLARTWDCGGDLAPRMEITATGFSRSIIMVCKGLLKSSKQTSTEHHDSAMRYFPQIRTVTIHTADIYREYIYSPIEAVATAISERIKRVQSGNLNAYVSYIFLVLIFLLLFL